MHDSLPPDARGVYRLPWTGTAGQSYYVAVDRRGKRRLKATVFRGHDPQVVVDSLWEWLDRHDSIPSVRLVG